ncbi:MULTISPECIES: hypothetical protein [Alphaproteobacteria]|jgi:hypothetical protein|nr:hypothetical protein [Maricaulis virginensis]
MQVIEDHVLPAADFGPVQLIDGFASYLDRLAAADPDPARQAAYRAAAAKVAEATVIVRGPDVIRANDF